jgi:hypothetical protein
MMTKREGLAMKSADHQAISERWSLTRRGAELLARQPESADTTASGCFERERLLEISLHSLILRESLAVAAGRFK